MRDLAADQVPVDERSPKLELQCLRPLTHAGPKSRQSILRKARVQLWDAVPVRICDLGPFCGAGGNVVFAARRISVVNAERRGHDILERERGSEGRLDLKTREWL